VLIGAEVQLADHPPDTVPTRTASAFR
jgi:hypothetical protein